jgi:hypothetical protein
VNPRVTVDYRNHEFYTNSDFYKEKGFVDVFDAEILMININSGTARVRLYHKDTNEVFQKNHDTSLEYIMEDAITIKLK